VDKKSRIRTGVSGERSKRQAPRTGEKKWEGGLKNPRGESS